MPFLPKGPNFFFSGRKILVGVGNPSGSSSHLVMMMTALLLDLLVYSVCNRFSHSYFSMNFETQMLGDLEVYRICNREYLVFKSLHFFLLFSARTVILSWCCRLWLFAKIVKKIASLLARNSYFLKTFSGNWWSILFSNFQAFILRSAVLPFILLQKPIFSWFLVNFREKKTIALFSNPSGSKTLSPEFKKKNTQIYLCSRGELNINSLKGVARCIPVCTEHLLMNAPYTTRIFRRAKIPLVIEFNLNPLSYPSTPPAPNPSGPREWKNGGA